MENPLFIRHSTLAPTLSSWLLPFVEVIMPRTWDLFPLFALRSALYTDFPYSNDTQCVYCSCFSKLQELLKYIQPHLGLCSKSAAWFNSCVYGRARTPYCITLSTGNLSCKNKKKRFLSSTKKKATIRR